MCSLILNVWALVFVLNPTSAGLSDFQNVYRWPSLSAAELQADSPIDKCYRVGRDRKVVFYVWPHSSKMPHRARPSLRIITGTRATDREYVERNRFGCSVGEAELPHFNLQDIVFNSGKKDFKGNLFCAVKVLPINIGMLYSYPFNFLLKLRLDEIFKGSYLFKHSAWLLLSLSGYGSSVVTMIGIFNDACTRKVEIPCLDYFTSFSGSLSAYCGGKTVRPYQNSGSCLDYYYRCVGHRQARKAKARNSGQGKNNDNFSGYVIDGSPESGFTIQYNGNDVDIMEGDKWFHLRGSPCSYGFPRYKQRNKKPVSATTLP